MTIIEAISKRKSCRTFDNEVLKPTDKSELEYFLNETGKLIGGAEITMRIIEKKDELKKMKLDYGMIQGHNTYVLGLTKSSFDARMSYGYLLEKVVLKATEMGISTCWVGYFDKTYFTEINLENGFEIPSIVILGYAKEKPTGFDKFVRFSANSSKRQGWEKLFFNFNTGTPLLHDQHQKYSDSLEMVRLAPSSGNSQPWRIYFDETTNEFHFFKKPINKKYEEKGLHDIDMGIALSHFELTNSFNNLSGNWIKHSPDVNSFDDLQYAISWKCQ